MSFETCFVKFIVGFFAIPFTFFITLISAMTLRPAIFSVYYCCFKTNKRSCITVFIFFIAFPIFLIIFLFLSLIFSIYEFFKGIYFYCRKDTINESVEALFYKHFEDPKLAELFSMKYSSNYYCCLEDTEGQIHVETQNENK